MNSLGLPQEYSLNLCAAVNRWRYDDLPPPVVHMLKVMILDTLGVIGGGAHAPGVRQLAGRLDKWNAGGSATGLIGKRPYPPHSAAMLNGATAHALDYDDIHDSARVHSNCVVFPTLLASAEEIGGVSGPDFLLAMATGVELHARLGLACFNSLGKGWHPTMIFGVLAGSVAVGRLLRLDDERSRNALGLAFHQACGSTQSARDGVLSKRLGAGFAAHGAVLSAFLAADGVTGTRYPLEGNAGLFSLYERNEVKPELLFDGLGEDWEILNYSLKPYPACRCVHTLVSLTVDLWRNGLKAEDIAEVEIRLGEVNFLTVGGRYDAGRKSISHAQFNAAYCFARTMTDGKLDLSGFSEEAVGDPAVAQLAARVRVVPDNEIQATAMAPAILDILLKDGGRLSVRGDSMKGSPQHPMSDSEVFEKFQNAMTAGIEAQGQELDRLYNLVMNLEKQADAAARIVELFPSDRSRANL